MKKKDFRVISIFKTEDDLLKLPPFEFQNWAVIALGIPNKIKSGDYGIDGKLYPIDMEKKKKTGIDLFGETDIYYPIQVKQKRKRDDRIWIRLKLRFAAMEEIAAILFRSILLPMQLKK